MLSFHLANVGPRYTFSEGAVSIRPTVSDPMDGIGTFLVQILVQRR